MVSNMYMMLLKHMIFLSDSSNLNCIDTIVIATCMNAFPYITSVYIVVIHFITLDIIKV